MRTLPSALPSPESCRTVKFGVRSDCQSTEFASSLALADKGWKKALADDPHLKNGLNVALGKVTCRPVADALGYEYIEPDSMLH